jgi:hypothetical protein
MKTIVKATIALLLTIILGLSWFAYKIGQERELAQRATRETMRQIHPDAYQEVRCWNGDHMGTYVVFMPLEITSRGKAAMNKYASAYCNAVFGPQGVQL